jgi:hypothetical protein
MTFLILGYQGLWLGVVKPDGSRPVRYAQVEDTAEGLAFAAAAQPFTDHDVRGRSPF